MQQQIHLVTLGVDDLTTSRQFYAKLGFMEAASCSNEHIAFYDMNGVVLALFPREALKTDIGIPDADPAPGGTTLAQNVSAEAEVDERLEQAEKAGATILSPGTQKPWGYTGYFADPDGHAWEVAYVPSLHFDDNNRLVL